MVKYGERVCPKCGGRLIFYDKTKRILRTKGRNTTWINLDRYRCTQCGAVHREIDPMIFPYKQYEYEIIVGVVESLITTDTYGFEDYPTELTMSRWRAEFTLYNGESKDPKINNLNNGKEEFNYVSNKLLWSNN